MKVLFYENSAGFSNYTSRLCNAFAKQFPTDSIYYMTQKDNTEIATLQSSIKLLDVLETYTKNKKYSIKWLFDRIFRSADNIKLRNKYCAENEIDVICIQATIPIIDQFYIKKLKKNTKVVLTVHDVIPPIKSFYYSKHSLKKIYKKCDYIIVHSQANKQQLKDIFSIDESKISVICHGTDVEYKKYNLINCRKKFQINPDKIALLFYGMIREQKGLDDLIRGLEGIKNIQLVIAGGMPYGESFDKYDELIECCNIDCVKMVQFVPNEWTDELYQACDIVCLPYKYFYSQSGVFMQGIKYRKPVVVSDVSCFSEYINKYKMGVLCKPCNAESINEAVRYLIKELSTNKEVIEAGLEKAAKENSWGTSASKYKECFGKIDS